MSTATAPAPQQREERVLTFGDVFGRDAGGLIVLLVLFGAMMALGVWRWIRLHRSGIPAADAEGRAERP